MLETQRKNIIVCADGTGNTAIKDRGTVSDGAEVN
jgi:hypothetical protein